MRVPTVFLRIAPGRADSINQRTYPQVGRAHHAGSVRPTQTALHFGAPMKLAAAPVGQSCSRNQTNPSVVTKVSVRMMDE